MLKKLKRGGVWALALSMVVTMTPASAFATGTEDPSGAPAADDTEQVLQLDGVTDPVEAGPEGVGSADIDLEADAKRVDEEESVSYGVFYSAFPTKQTEVTGSLNRTPIFEGLFRVYDGTNKWTTGTSPKIEQNGYSKLKEGTDFKREYAFCRNANDIYQAYDEKKKGPEYISNSSEEQSVSGLEGNDDQSGGEGDKVNKDSAVKPVSMFKDSAADMTEPGYILERISGLGKYEMCEYFYALHYIAVPLTFKADDAYKVKPGDYNGKTADPQFTYTMTLGYEPEAKSVKNRIQAIQNFVYVIRAEISGMPSSGDRLGDLTLIPVLDEGKLRYNMNYAIRSSETVGNKAVYELADLRVYNAEVSRKGEEDVSAELENVKVTGSSGSAAVATIYTPPVQVEMLPGTLTIENDDPLPASQSRIAKQLEATNLVLGEDGKYTTKVKMSLPLVNKADVDKYTNDIIEMIKEMQSNKPVEAIIEGPENGKVLKGETDGEEDVDSQAYAELVAYPDSGYGYGSSSMMGKQNEYVSTHSSVIMDLSSGFDLPVKEDGSLDISKMKLVDSMYFHDFSDLFKKPENGGDDNGGGNGGGLDIRANEGTDPMAGIMNWLTQNIFNEEPSVDGDFLNFDLMGHAIDLSEWKEKFEDHSGYFDKLDDEKDTGDVKDPEVTDPKDTDGPGNEGGGEEVTARGVELYGFGLKHWQTEQDYGNDILFTSGNTNNNDGNNENTKTYHPGDFAFLVAYFPDGAEEDSFEEMLAGDYLYSDPSLIDGPTLVVHYNGLFGYMDALNLTHHFSFEFEEELANPSTAPGTYGSYDQYGKNGGSFIKVVDKAILYRPMLRGSYGPVKKADVSAQRSEFGDMRSIEKPEEFYIPTVSYTIGGGGNNNGPGSGGRTSSGTSIFEPQVPLAEMPELNKKDHVAYVIGYEDGTVKPENYITRAEVSTIFFRLLTDDSRKAIWSSSNSYKDTVATAWYNNAVSTLSRGGVLTGYTDGTFLPSGNITRAEFATIAARFDESVVDTNSVSFTDISGHWAEKNIKRAAALGYITGYQDGSFKPNAPITRAEAMTLLNRVLGRDKITASGLLSNMATFSDNPSTAWYYVAVQEATNTHDYVIENGVETWTGILANRNWASLENEWATGAERGAEVFQPVEEEQPAEAEAEAGTEAASEGGSEAEA